MRSRQSRDPSWDDPEMFPDMPNQPAWPAGAVVVTARVKPTLTERLMRKLNGTRPSWFSSDGRLKAYPTVRIPSEARARCAYCRMPFVREFRMTVACPECDFRNVRGVLSNFELYRRMAKDERDLSSLHRSERYEVEETL